MKLERLTDVVGHIERDGEKESIYSITSLVRKRTSEHKTEYPDAYCAAHDLFGRESAECDIIKTLGRFEDVQDEFGVDLIKLLTAKTVYFLGWEYGAREGVLTPKKFSRGSYSFNINIGDKLLELCDLNFGTRLCLKFNDYGKYTYGGWAFTKEELQ